MIHVFFFKVLHDGNIAPFAHLVQMTLADNFVVFLPP